MIGIFVFSATGNTYKIADYLKEAFIRNNEEAELFKIEDGKEQITKDYDKIIICYPIHGFNMPTNVGEFCRKMPKGNSNVYFVKSSGEPLYLNNRSSHYAMRKLKKKGYKICGDYHYIMPYNMIFRHTDEMASKMFIYAKRRIDKDVIDMINLKPHFLKKTLGSLIMVAICKCEHWGMRLNGHFFRVNKKKCVNCMACVKTCPMKNIEYKKGKFKFKGKCLACTRCSFNCPKNAISIGLINFMKVNGKYNFNADSNNAVVGKYCKKAYVKYFKDTELYY